jgi:glycosyltransferase involved in cell wall biosynthesis
MVKRPKVLYFILRLDAKGEITGGSWSALHILRSLERHEPYVVVNRGDVFKDELARAGIRYEIIESGYPIHEFRNKPLIQKIGALFQIIMYNLKIFKTIKKQDMAIVQCDEMGALMVFLGTKLAGKKLVIYIRSSFRGVHVKWMYRMPMMFSDAVIAISKELRNFVKEKAGRLIGKKLCQIYNSVDVEGIEKFKKRKAKTESKQTLGICPEKIGIGVVGFIEKRKRQREFLAHVVTDFAQVESAVFYFIGGVKDERYHRECVSLLQKLGLTNAVFVGFQNNIYEWYRGLDLVCLPSGREGVPRALVEAAAFDLPCVCFDIPGCREVVIDRETGYLVKTFGDFSQRISELIASPERREEMGRRGYEHVRKNFDVRANTNRIEMVYEGFTRHLKKGSS